MSNNFIQYAQDTTKTAYDSLKEFAVKMLGINEHTNYPKPAYYEKDAEI
jgi:hypothetical protein